MCMSGMAGNKSAKTFYFVNKLFLLLLLGPERFLHPRLNDFLRPYLQGDLERLFLDFLTGILLNIINIKIEFKKDIITKNKWILIIGMITTNMKKLI